MAQIHEVAKSTILVDGKQAEQELEKLEKQAKEYANALAKAKLSNDHKQVKTAEKGLKDTKNQIRGLKKELFDVDKILTNLSGATIPQLNQARRKLMSDLKKPTLKRDTKEWKEKAKQLQRVQAELKRVNTQMKGTLPLGARISRGFNKVAGIFMAITAAVTGTVMAVGRYVKQNAQLSDTLTDVEKKTGLTKKEVKQLSSELKKIDTRSSRKELLGLAAIGGKLGIQGKENLLGFAKAADQINVALTEDLGGNTEETIRQIGKLVDLFDIKDEFGMEGGLLKVGSAINEIGQSSTANEGYLVNFARRLGGLATQADISLPAVLGIGSALDQLGQSVEMSGTAINKIIINMFQDTEEYAKIAKMELSEFSTLLNTDANEAFLRLLEGLNGNNEGLSVMAGKLDDLGVDGARAIGVLATLAGNTKLVRQEQALANDSFDKGISLTEEFNRKNNNLAAKLAKVRRRIRAAFVSSGAISAIEKIVSGLDRWTRVKISKELEEERIQVNMLVGELTDINIKEDRRREILEELQKIAPDIVETLTAEGTATIETTKALREYNREMINKIILSRKDEEIEKKQQNVASSIMKRLGQENDLRKLIAKRLGSTREENKYNSIWLNDNLTLMEKAIQLQKAGFDLQKSNYNMNYGTGGDPLRDLSVSMKREAKANKQLEELFAERKQLFESLFSAEEKASSGGKKKRKKKVVTPTGGDPLDYEKEMEAIEKLRDFLMNDLKTAYLEESMTREEYAYQTFGINMQLLEKEKSIRQKYGKDQGDVDGQILDKKIDMHEKYYGILESMTKELLKNLSEEEEAAFESSMEETQAEITAMLDKWEKEKELAEKEKALARELAEYKLEQLEIYADAALNFSDAVASGFEMAKNRELKAAGDNDKKKEEIEEKYAERQRRVSAFQATVEGLVEIARINSNAGVNADLTQTLRIILTTAAVVRTGMTVGAILSEQYAQGKYPVVGSDDGRTYNATWVGKPRTGFYSTPSIGLFNENPSRPEMVVDGATTQKLIFDYPQVYNAIRTVAIGGIPQFAEGKYPEQAPGSVVASTADPELKALIAVNAQAVSNLNARLANGIEAWISYSHMNNINQEMDVIKSQTSI